MFFLYFMPNSVALPGISPDLPSLKDFSRRDNLTASNGHLFMFRAFEDECESAFVKAGQN